MIWKFADEHPELDITTSEWPLTDVTAPHVANLYCISSTVNPQFIYGPLPRNVKLESKEAVGSYSTLGMFYQSTLQEPGAGGELVHPQFPPPLVVDVRDVARAHVLALKSPLTTEIGRKRMLIAGPQFTWRDATEHLKETHPALATQGQLKNVGTAKRARDLTIWRTDTSLAAKVLGLKEYVPWEKTVDDTTNSILEAVKVVSI